MALERRRIELLQRRKKGLPEPPVIEVPESRVIKPVDVATLRIPRQFQTTKYQRRWGEKKTPKDRKSVV